MTKRARDSAWMKREYERRRRDGVCINDGPRATVKHGAPFKGGRCRACWAAKLKAERLAYARG